MIRIVFILFFLLAGNPLFAQETSPNIIFMIGDGTGLSQITAGMYANGNKTALEDFEVIGLSKTHSANNLVTDSAASGTAMACGVKTFNGVIGINLKNQNAPSILEIASEKGYVSGLIATSSIVHATPASFYAKVTSRKKYEEIARQLSESEVDFFIGGGKKHFVKREDKRNILDEMDSFEFVSRLSEFEKSTSNKLGLFTNMDEPLPIVEGRKPALNDALSAMLNKLDSQPSPFFLMVEGSQIDWGGHANDLNYILTEFRDFDRAIAVALEYIKKNPNTLLVVTADHETGGLGIDSGNIKNFKPRGGFVTRGHTASMVPVFAIGIGAKKYSGIYDNTAIFSKMKEVLD